jgi:hypothetical protein
MRYFIVSYVQTPKGQTDELVSVSKRTKVYDIQTAAVILDFKKQEVVKASLAGTTIPREWQRIRDYYYQHYTSVIDQLEHANPRPAVIVDQDQGA